MTETVSSWGRGGTAAAMAQIEQTTEEHSTLEQQSRSSTSNRSNDKYRLTFSKLNDNY